MRKALKRRLENDMFGFNNPMRPAKEFVRKHRVALTVSATAVTTAYLVFKLCQADKTIEDRWRRHYLEDRGLQEDFTVWLMKFDEDN